MPGFSWLHLTDLHYGLDGQGCLWPNLRQPFLDDVARLHDQTGPWQAVLFTGDFVQRGAAEEFRRLQSEVLDRLWKRLAELGSEDAVLLAVPGNHDLYRPRAGEDNAALDRLLEPDGYDRIAEKFWSQPGNSYQRVVTDALAAYSEWWKAAPHRPPLIGGILPGDFSCSLECEGQRVGIVGLNTTFLQLQGGDYQHRLAWDPRQLHAVCGGAVDDWIHRHHLCLLLTHQGPDWLRPESRKLGEIEIAPAGRFAFHLFGHMHDPEVGYVKKGGAADAQWFCQGCSLFGMEKHGDPPRMLRNHGYAVVRLEFLDDHATFRLWPRVATDKPAGWRYVADSARVVLEPDGGTNPDIVKLRHGGANRSLATLGAVLPSRPSLAAGGGPMPHSTLPSRRPFFGRRADLDTVAKALHPDHVGWGIVIDGPGGMGKTALAVEAAHRAPAEHFPLKVFVTAKSRFLDAGGEREAKDHRVEDFFAMLSEIGLALGREDIPRAAPQERPGEVRHALAAHRVLLVLDNLESFTAAERRRLYDLLDSLPRTCRAIVTSRRREDTAARTLRLDRLDREAADQLMEALGEHTEAIRKLTAEERSRLYVETGGNPLLLTWTAGQLGRSTGRCVTLEEAIARLQTAHQRDRDGAANDPLAFVFGDLVQTFTTDETAVLAALAHFSGPARLEWLVPLVAISRNATQEVLDELRNRSLVIEDDVRSTWLLPQLAARLLRRSAPQAISKAAERLAAEGATMAVKLGFLNNAPFTDLESVWPVVEAALPLLLAGDNTLAQKVCSALDLFFDFSGRWDQWLSLSQEAESKALAVGDWKYAAWRASKTGFAYLRRGDAEGVLAAAQRCGEYADRFGDQVGEARLNDLRLRGIGYLLRKDYTAARAAAEAGVRLDFSTFPEDRRALAFELLISVCQAAGDLDAAEDALRETLRISETIGYRDCIASCGTWRATLSLDRGDWPAAEQQAKEALELAKGIGKLELVGHNECLLAKALCGQGRTSEALSHAREAVTILAPLRSRRLDEARSTLRDCELVVSAG